MTAPSTALQLESLLQTLSLWALCAARLTGFFNVFPLIVWLTLPQRTAATLAASLTLPMAILAPPEATAWLTALPAWQLALFGGKEYIIGMTLGVAAGIPFWTLAAAGELVDTYRGSNAGGLFDPSMSDNVAVFGSTLVVMALGAFVAAGGLTAAVLVVFSSFEALPIDRLLSVWSEDRIERLGAIGASVLGGAIGLAAALLLGMFCVDVATGFATRNARQFQLNELSMAVKNLAFASLLPILSAALLATVLRDLTRIPDLIRAMLDLFP